MKFPRRFLPSALLVCSCVVAPIAASEHKKPAAAKSPEKPPIAVVAGQPIYEGELAPLIQNDMTQLRNQEFEIKSRALDNLIDQKLLDAEAKKRGISTAELLKQEVESKAPTPTDDELKAQYETLKARINRPFDEIKGQLRQAVIQSNQREAREKYLKSLREKAGVEVLLEPPRLDVGIDKRRIRGNAEAPVTIVEFTDFQCPFCERVQPTLLELLSKYKGQVNLAFRDFPLESMHPDAHPAAVASRCAGDQGKFWQYHDLLFANRTKLDTASLDSYAGKLGLDLKQFDSCVSAGKYNSQIASDLDEGTRAGVSGTPAFFINGVFLNGARPQGAFETIIDRELAEIARKSKVKSAN